MWYACTVRHPTIRRTPPQPQRIVTVRPEETQSKREAPMSDYYDSLTEEQQEAIDRMKDNGEATGSVLRRIELFVERNAKAASEKDGR